MEEISDVSDFELKVEDMIAIKVLDDKEASETIQENYENSAGDWMEHVNDE